MFQKLALMVEKVLMQQIYSHGANNFVMALHKVDYKECILMTFTLTKAISLGFLHMRKKGPFYCNFSPLLQEKSLPLTKYLHACQINTPPCKKRPSSLF